MGSKEDAIASLDKWGALMGMNEGFQRKVVPIAHPPEVLEDMGNQIVAKDMTIQALRDDLKSRLAGELETAWSYVALFAVAAAKLAERISTAPHDPNGSDSSGPPPVVLLEGDKLEQMFAEYEIQRKQTSEGVTITVLKRSSHRVVLTLPIGMFPLTEDDL